MCPACRGPGCEGEGAQEPVLQGPFTPGSGGIGRLYRGAYGHLIGWVTPQFLPPWRAFDGLRRISLEDGPRWSTTRWSPSGVLAWLWGTGTGTGLVLHRLGPGERWWQPLSRLQCGSLGGSGGNLGPCRRLQWSTPAGVNALTRFWRSSKVSVSWIRDLRMDLNFLPPLQSLNMYGVQGFFLRRRGRWTRLGRLVKVESMGGVRWRRTGRLVSRLEVGRIRGGG